MQHIARWINLSETTFVLPPGHPSADYRVRIFTPCSELPFAGHPTLGTAHAVVRAGWVPSRGKPLLQECGAGLITVEHAARNGVTEYRLRLPEARSFVPSQGITEDPVCGSGNGSVAAFRRERGLLAAGRAEYVARQGRCVGRDGMVRVTLETSGEIWIGGACVTAVAGDNRACKSTMDPATGAQSLTVKPATTAGDQGNRVRTAKSPSGSNSRYVRPVRNGQ